MAQGQNVTTYVYNNCKYILKAHTLLQCHLHMKKKKKRQYDKHTSHQIINAFLSLMNMPRCCSLTKEDKKCPYNATFRKSRTVVKKKK